MKRFLFLFVMISGLLIATGPVTAADIGPPGIEITGDWNADQFPMDFSMAILDVVIELQTYTQWKEVPQVGSTETVSDLGLHFAYNIYLMQLDAAMLLDTSLNDAGYFLGPGLIINNNDNYLTLDYTG